MEQHQREVLQEMLFPIPMSKEQLLLGMCFGEVLAKWGLFGSLWLG